MCRPWDALGERLTIESEGHLRGVHLAFDDVANPVIQQNVPLRAVLYGTSVIPWEATLLSLDLQRANHPPIPIRCRASMYAYAAIQKLLSGFPTAHSYRHLPELKQPFN
jgi:hypothetical protein